MTGDLRTALKDASFAALVTAGLAFPIVAYRTEPDALNQLTLVSRWPLVAAIALAVFAVRFLVSLRGEVIKRVAPPSTAMAASKKVLYAKIGLGLLVAYPLLAILVAGPQGAVKWIDNFGTQILIYILLGWGLNIVVGLAGLLDLGYVAFYAVGAYSAALLSISGGLSFWLALPLAGLFAALWGFLIGLPVLRLRGDYLAIVTLAFAEIVRLVLVNWVPVTGGYAGISAIPKLSFFGIPFAPGPDGFAGVFGLPPSPLYRLVFMFYIALALALLTLWVTARLRRLPMGRAWEAMREDEIACRSLGINTVMSKLSAFASGAFFGGIAGAFFATRQGFISPESFVFMESAVIVAIVVLGGLGSQLGVAIAAVVMIGGTELLRELDVLKAVFGNEFDPAQYRMLLFGLAMVLLMIWRPRGLVSTREPTITLHKSGA